MAASTSGVGDGQKRTKKQNFCESESVLESSEDEDYDLSDESDFCSDSEDPSDLESEESEPKIDVSSFRKWCKVSSSTPAYMTSQIVLTLMKPLLNLGYCVTADNFYMSPDLCDQFQNRFLWNCQSKSKRSPTGIENQAKTWRSCWFSERQSLCNKMG